MFDRPPNSARGVPKTPRGGQETVLRKGNSFKFLKKDEGKKASDHNTDASINVSGGTANSSLQWTDSSRALRSAIATDMRREHKDPFADAVVAVPSKPPPQQVTAKAPAPNVAKTKQRPEWNNEPLVSTRKPTDTQKPNDKQKLSSQTSTPVEDDGSDRDEYDDGEERYRQEQYRTKNAFMKTVKPNRSATENTYDQDDEQQSFDEAEEGEEGEYGVSTGHRPSSFTSTMKVKFSSPTATSAPPSRGNNDLNRSGAGVSTREAARNFFGNRGANTASINGASRYNTKALDEDPEDQENDNNDYYAQQRKRNAARRAEEEEEQVRPSYRQRASAPTSGKGVHDQRHKTLKQQYHYDDPSNYEEEEEDDDYTEDYHDTSRGFLGTQKVPSSRGGNGSAVSRSRVLDEEAQLMASLESERQQCEAAKREYMRLQQGLEKEKARLAKQRVDEEQRLRRDRDELDAIIEEEKAQGKKDLKEAEDRIKSLRSTLQGEKETCKRLKEENAALRGQLDRLSSQQREHDRIHKGEVDRLRIEISTLTGRNQELMDMVKSSQTALLQKNQRDQRGTASSASGGATSASPQSRMIAAAAAATRAGPPARGAKVEEERRRHNNVDDDHEDFTDDEDDEADAYDEYGRNHRPSSQSRGTSEDVDAEDTGYDATTGQSGDDYERPSRPSGNKATGRFGPSQEEERRKKELRERRAKEVEERMEREEREREDRRKIAAKQREDRLKEEEALRKAKEEEDRKRQARLKADQEEEQRRRKQQQEDDARRVATAVSRPNTSTLPSHSASSSAPPTSASAVGKATSGAAPSRLPKRIPTVEELVADDDPMPPLDTPGDVIVSQRLTGAENNKKETLFRSGKREIGYSNGTRKVELPSGHVVLFFTNGDIKQTWPSNKTTYWYEVAQTMHTQLANGKEIFEFHASQQTERHHPDGTKEILYPEGIYKIMWADGREETMMPTGQ